MKAKLTSRMVAAIAPADKDVFAWDTMAPGFGVKVTPAGTRRYFVFYRIGGKQRRPNIGTHGAITCEDAREIAREWLLAVAKGKDPAIDKTARQAMPTMRDLKDRYMEEWAHVRKKPRSANNDRILWERHILPKMGDRHVAAVRRSEIDGLMADMRNHPHNANRARALLSKAFNLAEAWEIIPQGSNPVRHSPPFPVRKRKRRLAPAELHRLGEVLGEAEREGWFETDVVNLIRLLLFTGARLREIMHARWDWVNWHTGTLELPDSKTGEKAIMLSRPAMAVIMALKRKGAFLFPGRRRNKPLVNPNGPWKKIRARAGLPGLRLHDLRRTFATTAAGGGIGLPIIGALLGHSQAQTTQGYIDLLDDPIRDAADISADRIAAWMGASAIAFASEWP